MTTLKKINIEDIEKQIDKKKNEEYEKNGNDTSFFSIVELNAIFQFM